MSSGSTDESMTPVKIGKMSAPQKRTIHIKSMQIPILSTKGKGREAKIAINPKKIQVGIAFGESQPPKLWDIFPPARAPKIGDVMQVNPKQMFT